MSKVDLHIHSDYSDSSKSISEILKEVKEKQMDIISITDHDSFAAYDELCQYSLPCQIIKGIEISTMDDEGHNVHILGYAFSTKTPHIDQLCAPTIQAIQERSIWQIQQLQKHHFDITLDEVECIRKHSTAIYKQHIMQALIQNGYTHQIYSILYRSLFKNHGICEASILLPTPKQAIQAIHEDGGIAILAHPFSSHVEHQIKEYVTIGIDGLETWHSSHQVNEVAYLHEKAIRYELLETGGSDHHGRYGEEADIGNIIMDETRMEWLTCIPKCWK